MTRSSFWSIWPYFPIQIVIIYPAINLHSCLKSVHTSAILNKWLGQSHRTYNTRYNLELILNGYSFIALCTGALARYIGGDWNFALHDHSWRFLGVRTTSAILVFLKAYSWSGAAVWDRYVQLRRTKTLQGVTLMYNGSTRESQVQELIHPLSEWNRI